MSPKILRYLLPLCLSLMVIGCGSLKVGSPKQDKKIELPPDVGSNKYFKKRSGKYFFLKFGLLLKNFQLSLRKGEVSF